MTDTRRTVYLETSIIGYLASRPSRDLITAANQQMTHAWWEYYRANYELYIAQPVVMECSADPTAAQERLELIAGITRLAVVAESTRLAQLLMVNVNLPQKAEVDALHIALAAYYGLDFLLTWNCTHIANAELRRKIELVVP